MKWYYTWKYNIHLSRASEYQDFKHLFDYHIAKMRYYWTKVCEGDNK